jgi:nucleotide-binding universal stress UspA family protein
MITRILLATDGHPAAAGAARVAAILTQRYSAVVEVITVLEPLPVAGGPLGDLIGVSRRAVEEAAMDAARERVDRQLAALELRGAEWPVSVKVGPIAPTIAKWAEQKRAELIVLGLGRDAVADRVLGSETALRVTRLAHVPVLAVPAESPALLRTAVGAVDFGSLSVDAAQTAVKILAPEGRLHLAHALSAGDAELSTAPGLASWEGYLTSRTLQLEDLARALEGAAAVRVEPHLLEGNPARQVLRLADRLHADLVVAGSHGDSFLGRMLAGSVSTRLLRRASCAVLIAPPRTSPAELVRAKTADDERAADWAAAPRRAEVA